MQPLRRGHAKRMQLGDRKEEGSAGTRPRPWVLFVDDGELDDLREIAESLGATTGRHPRGASGASGGWRQPQRLLVVSDRRVATLGRPSSQEQDHFTTLAVLHHTPRALRQRIHDMGFDQVVERPAEPAALRGLLRDALYRGAAGRRVRAPVGYPVTLHAGWRRRDALLVQIGPRGCTLRLGSPVAGSRRVGLEVPPPRIGQRRLRLEGSVVREISLAGRSVLVSVIFHLDPETRDRLDALLETIGTALPPQTRA